jgi:hypothetical protein
MAIQKNGPARCIERSPITNYNRVALLNYLVANCKFACLLMEASHV